jgi:hypothetical protein
MLVNKDGSPMLPADAARYMLANPDVMVSEVDKQDLIKGMFDDAAGLAAILQQIASVKGAITVQAGVLTLPSGKTLDLSHMKATPSP